MRIFHYISHEKENDLLTTYIHTLKQAMDDKESVAILTEDNKHDLLTQACPDILHIHTCWDYSTAQLAAQMAKRGAAVILSPHGAFDNYSYNNEQHTRKVLRSIAYQRAMTQRADALLVTTNDELQRVLHLQWNSRVDVVKNALLDSTTTPTAMADEMIRFYRKIIDTRYFILMNNKEKECICILLREGVTDDSFSTPVSQAQRDLLVSLTETQWRRMFLYADDEDIRRHIDKAILKLHLAVPNINTEAIDRFKTSHPKAEGLLAGTSNDARLQRETNDEERSLRVICSMLLSAQRHFNAGTLSMNHLADLYSHLKYEDFDEDRLQELTKELGIYKFAQSIIQLLIDDLQLEDGFIPLKPHKGRMTKKIRKILIH
ncbi:MAG: glycosyltransferase [Prevotella sp.]|nr:glycosyltransferase [Prevotella sp.]